MILVLAMMIGLVFGFILGMCMIAFQKVQSRTSAVIAKLIAAACLALIGGVICLMQNWAYLMSYAVGLMVGLSPYATNLKSSKNEEVNGNGSENGNQ